MFCGVGTVLLQSLAGLCVREANIQMVSGFIMRTYLIHTWWSMEGGLWRKDFCLGMSLLLLKSALLVLDMRILRIYNCIPDALDARTVGVIACCMQMSNVLL